MAAYNFYRTITFVICCRPSSVSQNVIIQANHVNVNSWCGKLSEKYAESKKRMVPADILNRYLLTVKKSKMAAAAILKNRKIAISWPLFKRF